MSDLTWKRGERHLEKTYATETVCAKRKKDPGERLVHQFFKFSDGCVLGNGEPILASFMMATHRTCASIADLPPVRRRGAAFGLRQSMDAARALVGPLLATAILLLINDDYQTVFLIAAFNTRRSSPLSFWRLFPWRHSRVRATKGEIVREGRMWGRRGFLTAFLP